MKKEENRMQVFSSEQLQMVHDLIGNNEPSLFSVLQQLSKEVDIKTTIFLAREFILNCQSYENQRVGMEFLYMNGFHEEMQRLIEQNRNSENKVNQEWAEVYQIILHRKQQKKFKGELIDFSNGFKTEDPSLNCLLIFIKIYGYFELDQYEVLNDLLDTSLTPLMLNVDDTLLRIYFQLRENEMLFLYHWKRNETKIARKYAKNIIDNVFNQEKKCYVLIVLALTYTFDDYRKSDEYLQEAMDIADQYHLDFYDYTIRNLVYPFIYGVNGITEGIETDDLVEKAHLMAVKGDKETALDILSKKNSLTPFQEYYMGLATDDNHYFYNSYDRFVKEKDYFYAQLPLNELRKRGCITNEESRIIN
ncbi:hypothetical protein N781_13975 [Pontibacillus halophilus JSM 076056 = DSM 19796]|uniref:Uncharacterized protein n=1 Tax=Pontibacillus halophilus JSM 076056 = DSM 19796 TaxID=1385510 RepID=A0A0A5GM77_9BACI|nr:AimR family lysis-lysogeny pheromone receptor [Pontibacillus halophilus]KGX93059.1 hypothetical protein N781_13975 [Pontibacillus halophilus JSM 076056 = DSM 19796]